MRLPLLITLAAMPLSGCVQTFAGGAVETREQAGVIADRACHELDPAPSKAWAARLEDGIWLLWKRRGGVVVSSSIDARTGQFADPDASCIWTPDDG